MTFVLQRLDQEHNILSLQKYPIVWQGLLALKNDQAAVQLHLVAGNTVLAQRSLPPPEGGPLLRIVQRMRLEASQLDSVARRMTVSSFSIVFFPRAGINVFSKTDLVDS